MTQLRIACADGSYSRARSSGFLADRTISTSCRRNSGGYGGRLFGIGSSWLPSVQDSTKPGQLHFPGAWAWLDIHDKRLPRGREQLPVDTQDPQAAAARLRLALADLKSGRIIGAKGVTVGDEWREYLRRERPRRDARDSTALSASTLTVRGDMLKTIERHVGGRLLDELEAAGIAELAAALRQGGMAQSTVYTYLQALSAVYQRSGAKTNPVRAYFAEHRRRRTRVGVALRRSQELLARAQAIGLVLHGIDAGLRLGEIRARAWAHHAWGSSADDRARALIVADNIPSRGEGAELPRTGKVRRVSCPAGFAGGSWPRNPQGTGATGRVLHDRGARGLRGLLARLSSRAGIDTATFLTLRHTFANESISAGFPVEFVARQLRNTPAVCRTHYLRLTDDYVEPPRLEPGELPCDWLARVTGHAGTSRGTSEQEAE